MGFTPSGDLVTTSKNCPDLITWTEAQVSNWKIKPKMKTTVFDVWFNVYPNGEAVAHPTKDEANLHRGPECIECVHVYKEYEVKDK